MTESVRIEVGSEAISAIAEHLERGHDVVITRGGRVLGTAKAALPEADARQGAPNSEVLARRRAGLQAMEEFRRNLADPLTREEILEIVKEGRRA
ncbi:hypothetical protein [Chthonobacter rhizosphaerae]|uniref:hypothetical protein n=1 Tax=Chthonobacter rhizosphaerae TaxID=2735553 RepID=UPI0015EF386E|nr:hypothetical protein [Chthonobacter rhizosphaerae]